MPKKCEPCLAAEIKEAIRSHMKGSPRNKMIDKLLEEIPDCAPPDLIQMCRRKKRPPSAYNQFISTCTREGDKKEMAAPERLRACAAEWGKRK